MLTGRRRRDTEIGARFVRPRGIDGVELMLDSGPVDSLRAHFHDRIELLVADVPPDSFEIEHRHYRHFLRRDELLVLPAGEPHSTRAHHLNSGSVSVMLLEPKLVRELTHDVTGGRAGEASTVVPVFSRAPHLADAFRDLFGRLWLNRGDPGAASDLVSLWSKLVLDQSARETIARLPCAEDHAVSKAIELLHAQLGAPVRLADLAAVSGMSKYHLIRVFKQRTGMSPHAYHMQLRLIRAQRLLASGVPIAQSALDTGFADQAHLTRAFADWAGIPPGRYLRQIQTAPRVPGVERAAAAPL